MEGSSCNAFPDVDSKGSKRFIFARKLSTESSEYVFEPTAVTESDGNFREALLIKRATMGSDAKVPEEWNMIQMETQVDTMKTEKFPVAYLRGKDSLQTSLDIMISTTTKITLAKGQGPVYIIGEYMTWTEEDEDYASEEAEEDEDVDYEEPDTEDLEAEKSELSEDRSSSTLKENNPPTVLTAKRKLESKDDSTVKKAKLETEEGKAMEGIEANECEKAEAPA